jgi:hypothetical protein
LTVVPINDRITSCERGNYSVLFYRRTVTRKKLFYFVSFVSLLGLVGNASAALPVGWTSQDIGTTGGSSEESGGTWTVTADGTDIWGNSDEFRYVYLPLAGNGQMIARVVSNGSGSNSWAKGGVMIREALYDGSKYAMMVVTGSAGGGATFHWRPLASGVSHSVHDPYPAVLPPH